MSVLREAMRDAAPRETVLLHKLEAIEEIKPFKKKYSPSKIAYRFCPRLWALCDLGFVDAYEKNDALSLRRMHTGTMIHDRYEKDTSKLGVVYKDPRYGDPDKDYACAEMLLQHPSGIRGKYDAIIEGDDGVLYVTDFKSMNQKTFDLLTEPQPSHIKQIYIYLGMIEDMYDLDRPISGLYIYEGKSTHALREFVVPWTTTARAKYDDLLRLIALTEEAIKLKDPMHAPCMCTWGERCTDWDLDKLAKKPKRLKL